MRTRRGRGGTGQLLGNERRVVQNDGQEIVEVVCDASSELAETLKALRLMKLCLEALAIGVHFEEQPLGLSVHQYDPAGLIDRKHRVRCRIEKAGQRTVGELSHTTSFGG